MTDETACPFGCDEPWPHAPGGCVIRLDDHAWAELQRALNSPKQEPTPAAIEANRLWREMLATMKREGSVDV